MEIMGVLFCCDHFSIFFNCEKKVKQRRICHSKHKTNKDNNKYIKCVLDIKKSIKIDAAEGEILSFLSYEFLSKYGAYVTHNATDY